MTTTGPILPARAAYPASVLSGIALAAAFPGAGIWPLAPVGVFGLLLSVAGRGFLGAAAVGMAGGLAFWLALIQWLSLYLGPVPWIALAVVMGAYLALGLGFGAWACRWLLLRYRHAAVPFVPVVLAVSWLARETVSGLWPYGGFPWARLAYAVADSPAASSASWIGLSGLSAAVVWICAVPVAALWWRGERSEREADADLGDGRRRALAIGAVGLAVVLMAVPAWATSIGTDGRTVRVAAVQGNAKAGLFASHARGEWLANHIAATEAADLSGVELIAWPENSSDIDPAGDQAVSSTISALVDSLGIPLVFGTIQRRGELYFNSSLLWEPGTDHAATFDKRHPVPFAEYMPDRAFFHALAPDLVDLVQRNYTAGTSNGVFSIGDVRFGVNICFDIAYDDVLRDAVFGGASFIVSQTNNADFGYSDESSQQLAIARMQAIANGRAVVSISTVGYSAVIGPDGSVLASGPRFSATTLVADVPTVTAIAPGTVLGPVWEGLSLLGAAGVGCFVGWSRRARRRHPARKAVA